jgi:hypothetical protein
MMGAAFHFGGYDDQTIKSSVVGKMMSDGASFKPSVRVQDKRPALIRISSWMILVVMMEIIQVIIFNQIMQAMIDALLV